MEDQVGTVLVRCKGRAALAFFWQQHGRLLCSSYARRIPTPGRRPSPQHLPLHLPSVLVQAWQHSRVVWVLSSWAPAVSSFLPPSRPLSASIVKMQPSRRVGRSTEHRGACMQQGGQKGGREVVRAMEWVVSQVGWLDGDPAPPGLLAPLLSFPVPQTRTHPIPLPPLHSTPLPPQFTKPTLSPRGSRRPATTPSAGRSQVTREASPFR